MAFSGLNSSTFGALIDIESQPERISEPSAVVHKASPTPTALELDQYTWGTRYNGPSGHPPLQRSHGPSKLDKGGNYTESPTPVRSTLSGSVSPVGNGGATEVVQSFFSPSVNKYRVLSACVLYLANGMTDSAPGALIPSMEAYYGISYGIMSLIFVTQAAGFITTAFLSDFIDQKIGRSGALMLSEVALLAAYTTLLTTPPYGAVVFAYFLIGFGEALNLALNNTFCSNLANSTTVLGLAHGTYGIGGIIGPVIATQLVSSGHVWSRYYYITLGISAAGLLFAGWSFRGFEQEGAARLKAALTHTADQRAAQEVGKPSKMQLLARALGNRITLTGALFIFAYQGAEVSISGWVISFLIKYRHGDPAHVGYVTAGFWGGITVGRFVLSPLCHRVTERLAVFGLVLCALVLQLLVWFVPNIIGDAVAVSILGVVLGPVYPCGVTIFSKLLPRDIQVTSISFIGSAGSSGGAVAPFMTGMIAQAAGTWVLHPICIGMFVVMLGSWFCLPQVQKRTE